MSVQRPGIVIVSISTLFWVASASVADLKSELNPAERQVVEAALTAHERGDPVALIESLSPLVARVDDKKMKAVDDWLARRGSPPASEILADARVALAQQSFAAKLPKPGVRESLLVMKSIEQQVQTILQMKQDHPAMAEPLVAPETSAGFETRLWEMHVLHSRLAVAGGLAEYMGTLARVFPRAQLAMLAEGERPLIEGQPAALQARVKQEIADLEEREVELRIHRLSFARHALEDMKLTPDRVLAAFSADFDGRLVAQFFERAKKSQQALAREILRDPATPARAAAEHRRARELAGDLTVKANLLFEGMHWWMRGRYGRGPEVGGLAKSEWATRTPQGQFGLYMPIDTPSPTDPTPVCRSACRRTSVVIIIGGRWKIAAWSKTRRHSAAGRKSISGDRRIPSRRRSPASPKQAPLDRSARRVRRWSTELWVTWNTAARWRFSTG